jgi:tRNA (guanine-N7-)-methyltransferase
VPVTVHTAAAPHPPVRTYKRRAGRVTSTQRDALDQLWPRLGRQVDDRPLDLPGLFGRQAPVLVEIGFGMGDATAELAAADPARDVLAVDIHTPGQGNLLKLLVARGLTNVRVLDGDARQLLRQMVGSATLAGVRVFFPDPWPKQRHLKRRLVDDEFAELVADRLADGGVLHVATDMPHYAQQTRDVLSRHPRLEPVPPPWRPSTKFEQRGLAAGRPAHDLAAVRVPRC